MVPHTTTGEWQSFEARMRHRRAERLLLRAEAAIDAGCLEDAGQCLSEARTLEPSLPGLVQLEQKLSAPAPTSQHNVTGRRVAVAATVVIAGTLAMAGWMVAARPRAGVALSTAPAPPSAASVTASSPAPSAPAPPLPVPASVFNGETAAAPAQDTSITPPDTPVPALATIAPTADAIVPTTPIAVPKPDVSEAIREEATGLANRLEPPAIVVPAAPVSADALDLRAAPAIDPPSAPAPEPSQQPAVRSALERYAAAYSALDVDAAQRVWPTVNRGALARAFDSLAAQELSLGECRIDVDGATATARCAGTTTWSPKVGSGRRTEPRTWTFELTRRNAAWEIVSARVQNR